MITVESFFFGRNAPITGDKAERNVPIKKYCTSQKNLLFLWKYIAQMDRRHSERKVYESRKRKRFFFWI